MKRPRSMNNPGVIRITAAMIVATGSLVLLGNTFGFFGSSTGLMILALIDIIIVGPIIWWRAGYLERSNAQRDLAEAALRESEEHYRLLFDSNPHPIWVFDLKTLAILDVNEAAVRKYGYSKEEFRSIKDIRPAEDVPLILANIERNALEAETTGSWKHKKKDGTIIDVDVSSHKIVFAGREARLVVSTDVTERKRAEEVINKLNIDLEQRSALLSVANAELEAFCYSVAHDLRAPLRSIDGFSRALLEDYGATLGPDGQDHIARVRASTRRMGELIEDLLDLSKVTRAEMHRESVDLSTHIQSIADEFQNAHPERHVHTVIAKELKANGDDRLLRIALENLFANAWKFTSNHQQAHIEFGEFHENGHPTYFIRDDGAGFDMAYAERLFGPFQRLHGVKDFPGTGIGLATVQRIIHRHGGRVWAEGKVEQGAIFYFTL